MGNLFTVIFYIKNPGRAGRIEDPGYGDTPFTGFACLPDGFRYSSMDRLTRMRMQRRVSPYLLILAGAVVLVQANGGLVGLADCGGQHVHARTPGTLDSIKSRNTSSTVWSGRRSSVRLEVNVVRMMHSERVRRPRSVSPEALEHTNHEDRASLGNTVWEVS
jgi:hypothetical protein